MRSMSADRVTSAWTEACPSSSARAFAPSPFTSANSSRAPSRAKRRADAAPMPLAAPVMSACMPARRSVIWRIVSRAAGEALRCSPGARYASRTVRHSQPILPASDARTERGRLRRANPPKSLSKAEPRSAGANVSVAQVRGLLGRELVLLLQLSELVLGVGWHRPRIGRLQVEAVEAGGVQAKNPLLDRAVGTAKWRKPVFLLHVFGDLEAPQRFDLPLRGPVPHAVGTP